MQDFSNLTFGVEIETSGLTREAAARVIAAVIGGHVDYIGGTYDAWAAIGPDGRVWKAMRDSSILGIGNAVAEVVTPILTTADFDTLQAVIRALRQAGARSGPEWGCGIHVHVGAQGLSTGALVNLAKMVSRREGLIRKALRVDPARASRYCAGVSQEFIRRLAGRRIETRDDLAAAWYGCTVAYTEELRRQHYHHSRYHGLNLHSVWYRGTVEFRWFNGTLHAGEVKAYVLLCLGLVWKASTSSRVRHQPAESGEMGDYLTMYEFLYQLGIKGEGARNYQKHLLKHLSGLRRSVAAR